MASDLLRDDARTREAFKRGERWALECVYREYYPVATVVACRGFGTFRGFFNPADRDDAVQSIFTAAFGETARLRYNGLDPYSSYLRGIAQNVVRKMLEKSTRFKRTDGQPEPAESATRTAEESLLGAERVAIVRAFVEDCCDASERAVLQRYFVDGRAEEWIAADLSMTRYQVRKAIARLHKRMTVYLRDHGIA